MRPLLLSLEGFSCYSDEQPSLDFSQLQLFAIVGPTGAGKSSILDAVTYALYGYVPRLGKAGNDLITAGRDRLVARFDFALGQRRYRITRTLRRNKAAKVVFEDISNDDGQLIADKVADANQAVEHLLGIGYEGFSQSVILPQGQFDRFLRSQGSARRAVLTELLRLERYERMRRFAVQAKDKAAVEVQSLERQLADYAQATPDAVDVMRASVAAADETAKLWAETRARAEATAAQLQTGRQMTRELEDKEVTLQKLVAGEPDIESARGRLAASRRAEPLLPLLQAASEARTRANDAKTSLSGIEKEIQAAKRALDRATTAVDTATSAAAALPAMRERVHALDRLHGTVAHVREVRTRVEDLRKQNRKAADVAVSRKQSLDNAILVRDDQRAAAAKAKTAREAITFDPSLHVLLEPLLVDVSRGHTIEADVAKRKTTLENARAAARVGEQAVREAEERLKKVQAELLDRQHQLDGIEHQLEHARMSHMATELRGTLRPGEACPVCAQAVAAVPSAEAIPELDALKAARTRDAALVSETRGRLDQLRHEAAAKRGQVTEQRAQTEALDADVQSLEAELHELEERLALALSDTATKLIGRELRDWILQEITAAQKLKQRADAAQKVLDESERKLLEAEHAVEKAAQALQVANDTEGRLKEEIGKSVAEQQRLERQIAEVTSDPDPDAERTRLQQHADTVEAAQRSAQQALDGAQRNYEMTAAKLRLAGTTAEEREREAAQADSQARTACTAAGFGNSTEVKAAVLSQETQRAIGERIQEYEAARAQVESRVRELNRALGDARVTAEAVVAAEAEVKDAQQVHNAAIAEAARLRGSFDRLERDVTKAQELSCQLANAQSRLAVSEELARDLGGDRFQQYLLEETFEQLVRGASVRLKQLTNRYTLKWDDDQFYVVDHDNAREQRVAQTLSGGETFLASLALALELSDQILRTAGAVRIDSLFIDEGFGSLDAQSLDVAADAVEGLQAGGRMVGIITHLDALADRLPGCVRIDKRPVDGSLWRIERAG